MPTPDQLGKNCWEIWINSLRNVRVSITGSVWRDGEVVGTIKSVNRPASIAQQENQGVINILHLTRVAEGQTELQEGWYGIKKDTNVEVKTPPA